MIKPLEDVKFISSWEPALRCERPAPWHESILDAQVQIQNFPQTMYN